MVEAAGACMDCHRVRPTSDLGGGGGTYSKLDFFRVCCAGSGAFAVGFLTRPRNYNRCALGFVPPGWKQTRKLLIPEGISSHPSLGMNRESLNGCSGQTFSHHTCIGSQFQVNEP